MNKIVNSCLGLSTACLISLSAQAAPPTQPGTWTGSYNMEIGNICNITPTDTTAILTQKSYNNGSYTGTLLLKGFPTSAELPDFGQSVDVTYTIYPQEQGGLVSINYAGGTFSGFNAYWDNPPRITALTSSSSGCAIQMGDLKFAPSSSKAST